MPLLTPSNVWPLVQLIACLVIAWQLAMYRRGPSPHRRGIAWLAWLLVVACLMTVIKLLCGVRPPPGPLEALASTALAALLIWHRGDLAHALRTAWDALRALRRKVRR
ncbi:phage holin family protein [Dyella marensis]|uniref:phage holin family protein n=1 Tax=Dyella marensis TaxID=500610 RepID=UPI0031DBA369